MPLFWMVDFRGLPADPPLNVIFGGPASRTRQQDGRLATSWPVWRICGLTAGRAVFGEQCGLYNGKHMDAWAADRECVWYLS